MMTVLSPSTVAMSTHEPLQIEVWDWEEGECVGTLPGFGGPYVWGHALLSDGRFVAGDFDGTIRIGSLDNWTAATAVRNDSGIYCVLAGQEGEFITADSAGNIKLWENGVCKTTMSGAERRPGYRGVRLGMVGCRLVVIGDNNNLMLVE